MAIAMSRGVGLLVGAALMLAPTAPVAQGVVSGHVTMLEAPGAAPGDLADVVVYVVPVSMHGKARPDKVTISMHDRDFVPHVSLMSVGSTVQFQNEDPFQHNAFSNSPTGTFDVGNAVREAKGGKIEYRVEKAGIVHARIGKCSFNEKALADNASALINALVKQKPSTAKGTYIRSITVSSTMGPGVKIDPSAFMGASEEA